MATPTYLQWPSMGQGGVKRAGAPADGIAPRWSLCRLTRVGATRARDAARVKTLGKVLGNVARKVLDNRSVPHPLLDAR